MFIVGSVIASVTVILVCWLPAFLIYCAQHKADGRRLQASETVLSATRVQFVWHRGGKNQSQDPGSEISACIQILHKGRLQGPAASTSEAQELIANLNEDKMLYGSPFGSNDDWYWIYATVKAGETSFWTFPFWQWALHPWSCICHLQSVEWITVKRFWRASQQELPVSLEVFRF